MNNANVTLPLAALSSEPTHDEIALAAYFIWEAAGKPSGHEEEFWLQAKAKLLQEHHLLSVALLEAKLSLMPPTGNRKTPPSRSKTPAGTGKQTQRAV